MVLGAIFVLGFLSQVPTNKGLGSVWCSGRPTSEQSQGLGLGLHLVVCGVYPGEQEGLILQLQIGDYSQVSQWDFGPNSSIQFPSIMNVLGGRLDCAQTGGSIALQVDFNAHENKGTQRRYWLEQPP